MYVYKCQLDDEAKSSPELQRGLFGWGVRSGFLDRTSKVSPDAKLTLAQRLTSRYTSIGLRTHITAVDVNTGGFLSGTYLVGHGLGLDLGP
jgi:hypothetical protein